MEETGPPVKNVFKLHLCEETLGIYFREQFVVWNEASVTYIVLNRL